MIRPIHVALLAVTLLLAACGPAVTGETTPTPSQASTPSPSESEREAVTPTPSGSSASSQAPSPDPTATPPADPLLAVELVDVRSGETFTLGALAAEGEPVLLEPMAVWCSSCLSQQRQIVSAHELADFASVSLDVDLSESPADLASYADREGFDWSFAMADADLYRLLQDRFGVAATNPPSTPLIVIDPDGSVRALEFGRGVRDAGQVVAEIGAG